MNVKNYPKIAFGTWSWGAGMYGGDAVFGNAVTEEQLVPVFDEAMAVELPKLSWVIWLVDIRVKRCLSLPNLPLSS